MVFSVIGTCRNGEAQESSITILERVREMRRQLADKPSRERELTLRRELLLGPSCWDMSWWNRPGLYPGIKPR